MPNGDGFNQSWCNERHKKIDKQFEEVWKKMSGINNKLWTIILGQVAILGGIVVALLRLNIGG